MNAPTIIDLCSQSEPACDDSVRALLFGQLLKLAQPFIEGYQSDLYHDVHWIDRQVKGPMVFWYSVDTTGTAIGTEAEFVRMRNYEHFWRIELLDTVSASGNYHKWQVAVTHLGDETV